MGLLTDDPAPVDSRGGEGRKMVRLYASLDDDDKARLRAWVDSGVPNAEIHRRLVQHFDIGRSSVERGIAKLKASEWEC